MRAWSVGSEEVGLGVAPLLASHCHSFPSPISAPSLFAFGGGSGCMCPPSILRIRAPELSG